MFYLLTPFKIMNIERLNSLVRDYDNARNNLLDAMRVALYPLFLKYGRAIEFDYLSAYTLEGRGVTLSGARVEIDGCGIYFRDEGESCPLIPLEKLHPVCMASFANIIEKTARAATD